MKITIEQQANIYIYELNSFAKELGFSATEGWTLKATALEEKAYIEKHYYTTLSVKTLPDNLLKLFRLVKASIASTTPNVIVELDAVQPEMEYLVAFNPNRPIR